MVNGGQKLFRLPRHLLAVIANNNPQAIKALENLELQVGQALPEQVENLTKVVEVLADEIQGAYGIAVQALAVAENAKNAHQNVGYLGAVGVSECQSFSFEPVGVIL